MFGILLFVILGFNWFCGVLFWFCGVLCVILRLRFLLTCFGFIVVWYLVVSVCVICYEFLECLYDIFVDLQFVLILTLPVWFWLVYWLYCLGCYLAYWFLLDLFVNSGFLKYILSWFEYYYLVCVIGLCWLLFALSLLMMDWNFNVFGCFRLFYWWVYLLLTFGCL